MFACEQGGYSGTSASGYPNAVTVTYLKSYKNNNYTLTLGEVSTYTNSSASVYDAINTKTSTEFKHSPYGTVFTKYWYAAGYIS